MGSETIAKYIINWVSDYIMDITQQLCTDSSKKYLRRNNQEEKVKKEISKIVSRYYEELIKLLPNEIDESELEVFINYISDSLNDTSIEEMIVNSGEEKKLYKFLIQKIYCEKKVDKALIVKYDNILEFISIILQENLYSILEKNSFGIKTILIKLDRLAEIQNKKLLIDNLVERKSDPDNEKNIVKKDEDFVPPIGYSKMLDMVLEHRGIILLGEAGVGKTTVAESLVEDVAEKIGNKNIIRDLDNVIESLRQEGEAIYYFEDPWGRYKIEKDIEPWNEIFKYKFGKIKKDKYFIITSRTGIYTQADIDFVKEKIEQNVYEIKEEEYGIGQRKQILYNKSKELKLGKREYIMQNQKEILRTIKKPYSIAFFVELVEKNDLDKVTLENMIQNSSTGRITKEFLAEIKKKDNEIGDAAVICWIFYIIYKKINDGIIYEMMDIVDEIQIKCNVENFIQWMIEAKWMKEKNEGIYYMHPSILEGLEEYTRHLGIAAKRIIQKVSQYYVNKNISRISNILAVIKQLEMNLSKDIQDIIDEYLKNKLLVSEKRDFKDNIREVANYSMLNDNITLISRALCKGKIKEYIDATKGVKTTQEELKIVENYIKYYLPDIVYDPRDGKEYIFELFKVKKWDFSSQFLKILTSYSYELDQLPLEIIIRGALSGAKNNYNVVINLLLDEVKWKKEYYIDNYSKEDAKLDNAELDMPHINYIEQLIDDFQDTRYILERVIKQRIDIEGYKWIIQSDRMDELIYYWVENISSECSDEEIIDVFNNCTNEEKGKFLKVLLEIGHKIDGVKIEEWLLEKDLSYNLMKKIVEVLKKTNSNSWTQILRNTYKNSNMMQKIELLFFQDITEVRLLLTKDEQDICSLIIKMRKAYIDNNEEIIYPLEFEEYELTKEHRRIIEQVIRESKAEPKVWAYALAVYFKIDTDDEFEKMISSDDRHIRFETYQILGKRMNERDRERLMKQGLMDKYYQCNMIVMDILAREENEFTVDAILEMKNHPSAKVREFCAKLIGEYNWENGIPILMELIRDTRNKEHREDYPNYQVARMSAKSLCRFKKITDDVLEEIVDFIEKRETKDIYVYYYLAETLYCKENIIAIRGLKMLLQDETYLDTTTNPGYMLKYAGIWGLVSVADKISFDDSLISLISDSIYTTDIRLSGPALIIASINDDKFSDRIEAAFNNNEIDDDKFMIYYFCRDLMERKEKNNLDEQCCKNIENSIGYPLIEYKTHYKDGNIQALKELLKDKNINEWIKNIGEGHDALNFCLRCIFNMEEISLLKLNDKNFRKGELAENIKLFTWYE